MQRYFLNKENQIENDDLHHILNVMRFKDQTEVEVCFGGKCYLAKLNINGKSVSYETISEIDSNESKQVHLIQGLPKGDKIETVSKFATIFGAKEIIFVPMVRSIAKLANTDHKLDRLKKITKEAAELSKHSSLPEIKFFESLKALNLEGKTIIVLDENEKTVHIDEVLPRLKNTAIYVIVGPEGGIDDKERVLFSKLNALFVTLGKTIYPTELAHIPFLTKL